MIVRIWHGRTSTAQAEAYRQYVAATGLPEYQATAGNCGAQIWQCPAEGDITHIWTVSWWQDEASIEAFAGLPLDQARYYPDDTRFLLELEPTVQHYTVTESAPRHTAGQQFARQLSQLFNGGSWLGESFRDKLAGLSPAQALAQPAPGIHSVAELVAHCIYWRRAAAARVGGNLSYATSMESPDNWPTPERLRAQGWPALLQELEATQAQLEAVFAATNDAFLQREFAPGETLYSLAQGLLEHDTYHLGQMGLVLKILQTTSPAA